MIQRPSEMAGVDTWSVRDCEKRKESEMRLGRATTLADGRLTYHNTVVCESLENGKTRLETGGWHTVTTKRRMNQFAEALGHEWRVWQKDYEWLIGTRESFLPFTDGMIVNSK